MNSISTILPPKLLCFSHLRWDFVYQRPQHLLTRLSGTFAVYFIEEPFFDAEDAAYLSLKKQEANVTVVVPHLPAGLKKEEISPLMTFLLDKFLAGKDMEEYAFWYYTPMALSFSEKHVPKVIIYDCMDELSNFKFAPQELKDLENRLFNKADIVFTGGNSLYEAKRKYHNNIYPFPSSIDKKHFEKARKSIQQPDDQAALAGPKLGFYGVIDERFDIGLIKKIADMRPNWQLIIIGPVVKIDPQLLPANKNIHYLGSKSYKELPYYLAGWDVALIPFLLNESTKFISPTKTPEYLAAGIPVVSTSIRDVVNPYAKKQLVQIGFTADDFVAAIQAQLHQADKKEWLAEVDEFLMQNSWELTCKQMVKLMSDTVKTKSNVSIAS